MSVALEEISPHTRAHTHTHTHTHVHTHTHTHTVQEPRAPVRVELLGPLVDALDFRHQAPVLLLKRAGVVVALKVRLRARVCMRGRGRLASATGSRQSLFTAVA